MKNYKKFLFGLLIFLFAISELPAQENKIKVLTTDHLEDQFIDISSGWQYKPGDDLDWAMPNLDDYSWKKLNESLLDVSPDTLDWSGNGWFRRTLQIDSSLFGKAYALNIWQSGAMEFYINGKMQFSMGQVGDDENEIRKLETFPKVIEFDNDSTQVLAIRYSNHSPEDYSSLKFNFGIYLSIGEVDKSINSRFDTLLDKALTRTVFLVAPSLLLIIHFFLFWFEKKQIQNLYYVAFLFSFICFIYTTFQSTYLNDLDSFYLIKRFSLAALSFTIFFGALAIHSIYAKPPWYFNLLFTAALIIGTVGYFSNSLAVWIIGYIYILITSIVGSWILYSPLHKKPNGGEKIIQIGFFIMAAAGTYQMILSFQWLEPIFGIGLPYVYGVFIFLLSMSLSLARDTAVTNKKLEKQLLNVKELSEKTLKQELLAKELETERRILEADNERKTTELEEARSVQLAMLPQCLNDFSNLDICFFMQPATEVGGDYYDFIEAKDGTINIAVGDATGHGMKAGIMVATIKSLFSALGSNLMIPDFFKKCTEIIKSMSLGNLFMSMIVIRIKDGNVIGSSAGMPPILLYKKAEDKVEEIVIKSMPLGAIKDFPYELFNVEVSSGDVMLLLSDGFPELFNPSKELLGYENVKTILKKYVHLSSDEIVNSLNKEAVEWADGHLQEDDITFVAIKFK
jgi:serine phosphatase RsbU (regulator of sigma subunit)